MKWLKLQEPLMTGPEVTRLQEVLTSLGYDIGTKGPDGIFGPETAEAVKMFQRNYGLISDGCVGNLETWPILKQVLETNATKNPMNQPEVRIVDRRSQHDPPGLYNEELSPLSFKGEGKNIINSVTLHQSGCTISEVSRVYDAGNFHVAILTDGRILLTNPFEMCIETEGAMSTSTITVEFEGNMAGIEGQPETVWNDGSHIDSLSDAQIKASEYLFAWIKHKFEINGGQWKYVYAHRQLSADRRADPGSEIWQKVGMKWIEWLKGSDGGPDFAVGGGLPIPKQWNPEYTEEY